MTYTNLIKSDATATEIIVHLIGSEATAITIRLPQNLRNAAKKTATLQGTSFSSLVRKALLAELTKGR